MSTLRLGLRELRTHTRLTLVMSLAVAVPLMLFFVLDAFQASLRSRFGQEYGDFLLVQVSGSMGEFYGSRLPAAVGDELKAAGASLVAPAIHTIVGTTTDNAVLLRGVKLELYSQVEAFHMEAGRPLRAGDASRLAMVGARLAEDKNLLPGDTFAIRGRDFQVVGIFETHTYASHEAWISLEDAQALLGWGTDVSVYVIPNGEAFQEGDSLGQGVSVVRKGDSSAAMMAEWQPFFALLSAIILALGAAAVTALASILWRLAWMQRRELAILRSMGFGKRSLAGYLLAQGGAITLLGFAAGSLGAFGVGGLSEVKTAGISIQALFDPQTLLASLGYAALICLAGAAVPAWWLSHLNLTALLRAE
jgi:ABC-type lipoprotein release transport system permease subunit